MKRFDQINVIPFIDIMLVLLAIVLTTATFISQGKLDINVPDASNKAPPPDEHQLVRLGIDKNEVLFYNEERISLDQLISRISVLDKNKGIVIRVDKGVSFQRFITLLDLLKRYEMERLTIITRQK